MEEHPQKKKKSCRARKTIKLILIKMCVSTVAQYLLFIFNQQGIMTTTVGSPLSFLFFAISLRQCSSSVDESGVLISLELIHRDSPRSLLYSTSQNPWEQLANASRRSNNRIDNLRCQIIINAQQFDLTYC